MRSDTALEMHRHRDDLDLRHARDQAARRLEPPMPHVDVHQHDLWVVLLGELERFFAGAGFGDDFDVGISTTRASSRLAPAGGHPPASLGSLIANSWSDVDRRRNRDSPQSFTG